MPKPDSQTLANVTALLMAGSHSDQIVIEKIPHYMGIAQAVCVRAVITMPEPGDVVDEPPPPPPPVPAPTIVPAAPAPQVDVQRLIEEGIALAFAKYAPAPPKDPPA